MDPMITFWVSFAVGIVLQALQVADPALLAQIKPILIEIRDLLNRIYPPTSHVSMFKKDQSLPPLESLPPLDLH